jgi:hypothetical protein
MRIQFDEDEPDHRWRDAMRWAATRSEDGTLDHSGAHLEQQGIAGSDEDHREAGGVRRIPDASSRDRSAQLLAMAAKLMKLGKRKTKLLNAAADDVNNAELLYILSKGSPARSQEGRPSRPRPAIRLRY